MSVVAHSTIPSLSIGTFTDAAGGSAARPAVRATGLTATSADREGAAAVPTWIGGGSAIASAAGWLVSALEGGLGGVAGYAEVAASTGSAAAKAAGTATKAAAASTPRITGEWSFLTDPALSIEDKLARFLVAVQKKMDDELTTKMEDYRAKYGEGGSESKKEEGGGIFGTLLKILCPPLAIADSIFGGVDEFLAQGLKTLGGPLLAALATALGMPGLAPAALQIGKGLGEAVVASRPKTPTKAKETAKPAAGTAAKGTASTSAAKDSSSPSSKTTGKSAAKTTEKGEAGSPDERLEMLEIQRLVEKQNQLFTLVSNVMKSMHDTAMTAVQNVR